MRARSRRVAPYRKLREPLALVAIVPPTEAVHLGRVRRIELAGARRRGMQVGSDDAGARDGVLPGPPRGG